MIPVADALVAIFALVDRLGPETVPLRSAAGRVLTAPVAAKRAQPPFPASAMDGYAIAAESPAIGDTFHLIGESTAGDGYHSPVTGRETVRIFTGAPAPEGTARILIQEDVSADGDTITLTADPGRNDHIRAAGVDFPAGQTFAPARRLKPADLALIAAMGHGQVSVARRPIVAIIATGDELVAPGEPPGPDQITASNHVGLAAMVEAAGAEARILPIAADTDAALTAAFDLASGADLILTIGGASVGDRDRVAQADLDRTFYKVAMRPGKPLMAGRMTGTPIIGLPGNPVASLVCGTVFVVPALLAMQGLPAAPAARRKAPLAQDLPANGPREHYMRATLGPSGVSAAGTQDSSLLTILSESNVLVVRPPEDPPRRAGDFAQIIDI